MATVVPFTCPHCSASLQDLKPVGRYSRNGNPVFEYSCAICGSMFPLSSKHCMNIFRQTLMTTQHSSPKCCVTGVI